MENVILHSGEFTDRFDNNYRVTFYKREIPDIEVNNTEIGYEGETIYANIYAAQERWSLDYDPSMIEPSIEGGIGNKKNIPVNVLPNSGVESRWSSIIVRQGDKTASVVINQDGDVSGLNVRRNDSGPAILPSAGYTISFNVTSGLTWSASSTYSYLTVRKVSDTVCEVDVAENTGTYREFSIVFTNGVNSYTDWESQFGQTPPVETVNWHWKKSDDNNKIEYMILDDDDITYIDSGWTTTTVEKGVSHDVYLSIYSSPEGTYTITFSKCNISGTPIQTLGTYQIDHDEVNFTCNTEDWLDLHTSDDEQYIEITVTKI